MFKTLMEWFGFDPIEPRRHPEIKMMRPTLFDSEVKKQQRRRFSTIDRDRRTNDHNLGRQD